MWRLVSAACVAAAFGLDFESDERSFVVDVPEREHRRLQSGAACPVLFGPGFYCEETGEDLGSFASVEDCGAAGEAAGFPAITYPDRDYLCIVDGCYTIEFIHNPSFDISGLSFTVESPTAFVEKSLGDFQTYIDFCVEGTEFNHNPTSSPTISALPTPAPSSSPSSSPSSAPSRSPCQYLFRVFLVEVLRRRGGK